MDSSKVIQSKFVTGPIGSVRERKEAKRGKGANTTGVARKSGVGYTDVWGTEHWAQTSTHTCIRAPEQVGELGGPRGGVCWDTLHAGPEEK